MRQRGFARRFGRDLLHRKERVDPESIERIQHQKRNPEIGKILDAAPTRGEQRQQIDSKKQEQPRTDAEDQRLRAIVREIPGRQSVGQITALTQLFGVYVQPEGGTISHGLATALVGAEGSVIKIWRGNAWQPSEVIDELRKAAKP